MSSLKRIDSINEQFKATIIVSNVRIKCNHRRIKSTNNIDIIFDFAFFLINFIQFIFVVESSDRCTARTSGNQRLQATIQTVQKLFRCIKSGRLSLFVFDATQGNVTKNIKPVCKGKRRSINVFNNCFRYSKHRNQVVHLLNMFIKMRIFRKLYSTNKSHDFQDNRDLYEFTESADVERENKENLLIDSKAKNDQTDSEIVGDLCSKAHNDLAQIENTNGSMNVSYMAANQSVQIGLNDCLRCVVETKGNQILRFLTRISLHRWPLASIAADDHESSKYRPHDSIDGVRRASEMNELRLKSMQLLRVHNRTTNVSNPFSRTNPMYRTVGNSKNENMLYTRPDQTIQEPIYNRSLHPNSLRVGQSKLHQRSFNTLV